MLRRIIAGIGRLARLGRANCNLTQPGPYLSISVANHLGSSGSLTNLRSLGPMPLTWRTTSSLISM